MAQLRAPIAALIAHIVLVGAGVVIMAVMAAFIAVFLPGDAIGAGFLIVVQFAAQPAPIDSQHCRGHALGTIIVIMPEGKAVFAVIVVSESHHALANCPDDVLIRRKRNDIQRIFLYAFIDAHHRFIGVAAQHGHRQNSAVRILRSHGIPGFPCEIAHKVNLENALAAVVNLFGPQLLPLSALRQRGAGHEENHRHQQGRQSVHHLFHRSKPPLFWSSYIIRGKGGIFGGIS